MTAERECRISKGPESIQNVINAERLCRIVSSEKYHPTCHLAAGMFIIDLPSSKGVFQILLGQNSHPTDSISPLS